MSTRFGRTASRLLVALMCSAGVGGAQAQSTSTWITAEGGDWGVATNWSPAVVPNSSTIIADFSTLALPADLVVSSTVDRSIGGFLFGDTDGTPNTIQISSETNNFKRFSGPPGVEGRVHVANGTVIFSNRFEFSASSGTRKTGPGTIVFAYVGVAPGTNGLILEDGIVEYGTNNPALFNTRPIVFEGGTLRYPFGALGSNLGGQILTVNPAGGTLILTNGTAAFRPNANDVLRGSGTLVVRGGGLLFLPFSQPTFTGAIALEQGSTLQVGSTNWNMPNATVQLGTGTYFKLQGGIVNQIGRLTGTGEVTLVSGNPTLVLGDNGASPFSVVYYGANNTSMILTKTGTSTMVWAGTNAHSGVTTVAQGTMIANGLHTGGANGYTVAADATLSGTGTIRRAVTVNGIIAPGDSGIGTLTTSNVTWNAGTNWAFQLGAAGVADQLASLGTFVKGAGAGFAFDLQDTGVAGVYTLVTWVASTTFASGDFSAVNVPAGLTPSFVVNASDLTLTLTSSGGSPLLGVTPASLGFSAVEVGLSSGLVFVVTNSGDALLTGTAAVTGVAPFSVTEGGSFSLAAGEATNVVITFAPLLPESFADGVLFSTDGGSFTGEVTGLGYLLASATNSSIALSGGLVGMQFGLASGASYRVQATTNLLDGAGWTDLTLPLTNRSGPALTFTDTNSAAVPSRTYRIQSP